MTFYFSVSPVDDTTVWEASFTPVAPMAVEGPGVAYGNEVSGSRKAKKLIVLLYVMGMQPFTVEVAF